MTEETGTAAAFDRLLTEYETGQLSRRELLSALTALPLVAAKSQAAAPAVGAAQQVNHVTLFVSDVEKSVDFYQRLFGMPVLTLQGRGVNLRVGSSFLGIYPADDEHPPGIHHVCLGLDDFDADVVLKRLESAGVKGQIYRRGETKELYFNDPDGLRLQLQDVRYRGGIGPLGDRDPEP